MPRKKLSERIDVDLFLRLREEAGDLSAEAVARLAGVGITTVYQLERGEKCLIKNIGKVAAVFGRRPEDFFITDTKSIDLPYGEKAQAEEAFELVFERFVERSEQHRSLVALTFERASKGYMVKFSGDFITNSDSPDQSAQVQAFTRFLKASMFEDAQTLLIRDAIVYYFIAYSPRHAKLVEILATRPSNNKHDIGALWFEGANVVESKPVDLSKATGICAAWTKMMRHPNFTPAERLELENAIRRLKMEPRNHYFVSDLKLLARKRELNEQEISEEIVRTVILEMRMTSEGAACLPFSPHQLGTLASCVRWNREGKNFVNEILSM